MNKKRKTKQTWVGTVVALTLTVAVLTLGAVVVAKQMTSNGVPRAAQGQQSTYVSKMKATVPTSVVQERVPGTEPPQSDDDRAKAMVANMTLHEKVCQLFIAFPQDVLGGGGATQQVEAAAAAQALEQYPVGGFLLDKMNIKSKQQLTDMLATLQANTKIPLIITCDEEGGRVNRLMSVVGTTKVNAMLSYKDKGAETARANAKTIATDLRACGLNMDLAPVADVWSNPDNKVIGDRAYSTDYKEAATLVAAAVQGFHEGGVATSLKHFPGHGDTSADSHYGAVYVKHTLEELRERELVPFKAGIAAGADSVMLGHLIVEELGEDPAPFSEKIVTELLRGELGFDGVVITDGLRMKAMTDQYTSAEIAVKAVKAGVDLLLCPAKLVSGIEALEKAVETGEISEQRLDESVVRILKLKLKHGMIPE